MMTTDSMKKSIVDSYSKLAKATKPKLFANLFSCCDHKGTANQIATQIGYSEVTIHEAPEGANLGVGCGNPSALANIQEGQTVIDLGSGAGFDAFIVSNLVKSNGKVIGIDLSDEMIKLARKNAKKGDYTNVKFVKGDIEKLPLESTIADHIISNCVINLSQNKRAVFKEAFRVLTPGGKLSISDIVLEKKLPESIKNSLAGHVACVSGAEQIDIYLQYIKEAGFKNIKIESKTNFPLTLMLADPQLQKIAKEFNFDLNSEQAKELASRVSSVSISALK